jgi:hypothetical protein
MNRILAIEPDIDRGVRLQLLLREHLNSDLVLVRSADAAITAIDKSRPDVILTSTLLAASDEQELLAHLRVTLSLRHLPVLTIPPVLEPVVTERRSRGLFSRLLRRSQPQPWRIYDTSAVITRIEEALEQSKIAAAQLENETPEPVLDTRADTAASLVLHPEAVASKPRKRARRLPVSDVPWLTAVRLAWGESLRLLNISSSGMLVESGVRLSPGSPIKIQLNGPGLSLAVPARVTRCRVSDVDSLGVKYQTAAMFERPVEDLIPPEQEPGDAIEQLHHLVAAVTANAACGIAQTELRAAFENGVLDLITAHDVRLRDVPFVENDGRESIYFTIPTGDGSRAVLQVTFNTDDAPGLEDFDVLTAAVQAAAHVLPLTGTARQTALDLQIA